MEQRSKQEITTLLLSWNQGNKQALDQLMPLVTEELRRLAQSFLRAENPSHILQPTALVNECYLRLVDRKSVDWHSRTHFFGFAARTMRRILVEHARARRSVKRGRGSITVSLDEASIVSSRADFDLLALDQALEGLARLDSRQSQIVELRFFGGLTIPETAALLGVGEATISRDWTCARAWLSRELKS